VIIGFLLTLLLETGYASVRSLLLLSQLNTESLGLPFTPLERLKDRSGSRLPRAKVGFRGFESLLSAGGLACKRCDSLFGVCQAGSRILRRTGTRRRPAEQGQGDQQRRRCFSERESLFGHEMCRNLNE